MEAEGLRVNSGQTKVTWWGVKRVGVMIKAFITVHYSV